jgi:hypothetical protein
VGVDIAKNWRGTKQRPVDLMEVEKTVLDLARLFDAEIHGDGWNFALLAQRCERQLGRSVWTHTMESSRLDAYATLLKTLFVNRQIRIPCDAELLEQLENLQGEELRRRDQVRFTAVGQAHDDLPCALCLSCEGHIGWRTHHGKLTMHSTRIGRVAMPEIDGCYAARISAEPYETLCPIAGEAASASVGCRKCAMYEAVRERYATYLQTHEFVPIGEFANVHFVPNTWLHARQFHNACVRLM